MNIYIDESGSLTRKFSKENPYFFISMVRVLDSAKLKTTYKRYVSSRMKMLKAVDRNNKMFKDGKFQELKGSALKRDGKKDFVKFFAQNHYFEVYIIRVNNRELGEYFYRNSSRAFNFTIRKAMKGLYLDGILPEEDCSLQLDERNEKTETKYFLENYLNTELVLADQMDNEFSVSYYDSKDNQFVQVADVFSNLFYAHSRTGAYEDEMTYLRENGYLKYEFFYPFTNDIDKENVV